MTYFKDLKVGDTITVRTAEETKDYTVLKNILLPTFNDRPNTCISLRFKNIVQHAIVKATDTEAKEKLYDGNKNCYCCTILIKK